MPRLTVSGRDVFLLASTRVALGIGIGLLMSRRLREGARRRAGRTLLAIGALTTIPLVRRLRAARHTVPEERAATARRPWGRSPDPATGLHAAF